jgi:sigma-E factor negative regulatory protein RseC
MEEIGIVKELREHKAIVMVKRQSACDKCAVDGVCKGAGDANEIEALNEAGAGAGDTVRVAFRSYTYLKGTLLIYGIPAVFLVLGAVIGKEVVSMWYPQFDADLASALCGFGLLIASFAAIKLFARIYEAKKEYMPVVQEIITHN